MDFHQVTAESINLLKEASVSFLAVWYFKLLLKCAICSQNLWFFDKCSKYGVFPKYMKLKTNNKSKAAKQGSVAGLRKWLAEDKKIQFRKRGIYNVYLKVVHTELLHKLNYIEFLVLDTDTREKVNSIIHKKYLTQNNKLSVLISNSHKNQTQLKKQKFSDHKFFDRFINLSSNTFSETETKLIEKGFKYNFQENISPKSLEVLGVETELALNNIPLNTSIKHEAASLIKKEFLKTCIPKQDIQIAKDINNKSSDIIFTKADKGNTVVAINKVDYIQKTLEFLNLNNYLTLKRDPTDIFQKTIKTTIQNCKSLFSDMDSTRLTLMNPQSPKLYSLIKLHKPGYPIRPVVSFFSAPSYKLSKKLIDIIKSNTNFSAKFEIKNSYDLVKKIENITLPNNAKLISFDVTNLFPSIPINETITLVDQLLSLNRVNLIIKQDIINSLTVCLNQNYFEFNNITYTSKNGLIMGNPLSPLLAEIFMDSLESQISKHPLFKQFLYWHRYVDDVLTCFIGTDRQLKVFIDFINSLHRNIKFTVELETDSTINFLDLTIRRENNRHVFSIFHKPSHTDIVIHNSSCHPIQHKLAAFHSMIHRLVTLPLNKVNFTKELNIIKQIAINNGYNPDLIDQILRKKSYKKAINLVFPHNINSSNSFKLITFIGHPSKMIGKFLNKFNINVAYKTNNTLGKFIKNSKSKTDKNKKSGVYQLTCKDCPKTYVGQTGRNFQKRIHEHYQSFIKDKNDSNYANHLIEYQHNFDPNFKILHSENKGIKLNLLESLEINKLKNSNLLLNDQLDLNNSPLLNLFH